MELHYNSEHCKGISKMSKSYRNIKPPYNKDGFYYQKEKKNTLQLPQIHTLRLIAVLWKWYINVSLRLLKVGYLTSNPSKTYAWSSAPRSLSGVQPGRAQPTLILPTVTTSNSKYHFPWVTAYDRSGLNTLHFSAEKRHGFDNVAVHRGNMKNVLVCWNMICIQMCMGASLQYNNDKFWNIVNIP